MKFLKLALALVCLTTMGAEYPNTTTSVVLQYTGSTVNLGRLGSVASGDLVEVTPKEARDLLGDTRFAVKKINGASGVTWSAGTPEASVQGWPGWICWDVTGNAAYFKDSGEGTTTGWVLLSGGGSGTAVYVAGASITNPNFDTSQFAVNLSTNVVIKSGAVLTNLSVSGVLTTPELDVGTIVLTNALGVASGGTGRSSVTADKLLSGNGPTAMDLVTVSTGLTLGGTAGGSRTLAMDGTATTASAGDNDTSIATTAFVQTEIDATQTGTHASPSTTNPLSPTWSGPSHTVWYGATGTINLPAASGYVGRYIEVYNTGAFTITIDPNGSEVIVRAGTVQTGGVSITLASGAGNFVFLQSDGTRWITKGSNGAVAQGS